MYTDLCVCACVCVFVSVFVYVQNNVFRGEGHRLGGSSNNGSRASAAPAVHPLAARFNQPQGSSSQSSVAASSTSAASAPDQSPINIRLDHLDIGRGSSGNKNRQSQQSSAPPVVGSVSQWSAQPVNPYAENLPGPPSDVTSRQENVRALTQLGYTEEDAAYALDNAGTFDGAVNFLRNQ
jgi:hypothetical protein